MFIPRVRERLHDLKKGLFSALELSDLLHTGPKLELKKGTLLAHVNAPLRKYLVGIYTDALAQPE